MDRLEAVEVVDNRVARVADRAGVADVQSDMEGIALSPNLTGYLDFRFALFEMDWPSNRLDAFVIPDGIGPEGMHPHRKTRGLPLNLVDMIRLG